MPRNKSERLTPQQKKMLVTLDALRELVRLNLEAGQRKDFNVYLSTTPELRLASDRFNDSTCGWDPFDAVCQGHKWRNEGGWPGVLRFVEDCAEEQGCAT